MTKHFKVWYRYKHCFLVIWLRNITSLYQWYNTYGFNNTLIFYSVSGFILIVSGNIFFMSSWYVIVVVWQMGNYVPDKTDVPVLERKKEATRFSKMLRPT
jgi:hypothetical protein